MSVQLLPNVPTQIMFDDAKNNVPSFTWLQWIQSVVDLINRVVSNRVTASGAAAVTCNGAVQSTGVGTIGINPQRYAELWINARVTFNLSAPGTLYVYVVRTLGAIPANGAAPGGSDVIVAADAFAGPATVGGQNMSGALSWIDSGLDQTKKYLYYFAVKGTNALTANLAASSQMQVSEL